MSHGGFDEARYDQLLRASAHPDMAPLSVAILSEMQRKHGHVTRRRQQVAGEEEFFASGVNTHLREADIGPFLLSLRPIDDRSVSTIGVYRRRDDEPFSERETRIAHIVLSEVAWLHEEGWPEDRAGSVPRLAPRYRLALNLLLDGRNRKAISTSLALSEHTVATYQKVIYTHFGVNSQPALMRRFQLGDGGDR
jgi:DNA-binding NarL/FixJ family response regulator